MRATLVTRTQMLIFKHDITGTPAPLVVHGIVVSDHEFKHELHLPSTSVCSRNERESEGCSTISLWVHIFPVRERMQTSSPINRLPRTRKQWESKAAGFRELGQCAQRACRSYGPRPLDCGYVRTYYRVFMSGRNTTPGSVTRPLQRCRAGRGVKQRMGAAQSSNSRNGRSIAWHNITNPQTCSTEPFTT